MKSSTGSVIENWFTNVWVKGDEGAIDELMDKDVILQDPGKEARRGIDHFKETYIRMHELFDSFECTVTKVYPIENGEKAHCRLSARYGDKKISIDGDATVQVRNGKIVECSNDFDQKFLNEISKLPMK